MDLAPPPTCAIEARNPARKFQIVRSWRRVRVKRAIGHTRVLRKRLRAVHAALNVLARPVRAARGEHGFVLQPYRGYGSSKELFLIGRVFRQPMLGSGQREGLLRRQLIDIGRGLFRRGVADAALVARFDGTEQHITTDRDGYFRVHMRPARSPDPDRLWHRMSLDLVAPARAEAEAQLFVPPVGSRYVVISDIDDTVMYTGVASKAKMLWRLFMQGPQSRVAFPGVAALLRALHDGASRAEFNPMLYVSRGPWSIYEVLDEFFNLHNIPVGPLLFLREWGVTLRSPLPRRAKGHKLELIRNMLSLYEHLPFILIGDSGQHDPEVYAQIVREHPGRVVAIYIRNVSRAPARREAIEALAVEVADAGSSLLLAADSLAMARHAAEHGLISPAALAEVVEERGEQGDVSDPRPTCGIERPTASQTRQAVEAGELDEALDEGSAGDAPQSVAVEPGGRTR
jgi:phosphatidate phosphatase APP1